MELFLENDLLGAFQMLLSFLVLYSFMAFTLFSFFHPVIERSLFFRSVFMTRLGLRMVSVAFLADTSGARRILSSDLTWRTICLY